MEAVAELGPLTTLSRRAAESQAHQPWGQESRLKRAQRPMTDADGAGPLHLAARRRSVAVFAAKTERGNLSVRGTSNARPHAGARRALEKISLPEPRWATANA